MSGRGSRSSGAHPKYCGELGKRSNRQWLVSLTLTLHEVPEPVGLRLLLPKEWTEDLPRCAADGFLIVTDSAETGFARIEDDLIEFCRRFRALSVAFDPWAATQFARRMSAQGVPMVEFRATIQNFSEPTKELDAAMRAERLQHKGNPVLQWCIGNMVGRYDARSSVYPCKIRPEQRIDAAITTIMGIGRALAAPPFHSRYEDPNEKILFV